MRCLLATVPSAPADEGGDTGELDIEIVGDVPPEDMVDRDVDSLRAMAIGHAEFAQQRTPGQPLIRIFNPTIATHGWQSTHTIVEVITDDMPFLVDSVGMALNHRGLTIHLTVHPLIRVLRDDAGNLLEFVDSSHEGARAESFLHIEIDCETSEKALEKIKSELEKVLYDVACAVEDWKPMRDRIPRVKQELATGTSMLDSDDVGEASEYLDWLAADNFTFLGYRQYNLRNSGTESWTLDPAGLISESHEHYDEADYLAQVEGQEPR